MCGGHTQAGPSHGPPDWETVPLPPSHILSHLTDAHCHPTDLEQDASVYDNVQLGGLGAMPTIPEDQSRVDELSISRPWKKDSLSKTGRGPKVIACFGYHPWFTHRYTLQKSISKRDHYTSIFFPPNSNTKSLKDNVPTPSQRANVQLIETLLPYLPDPIPFTPLLQTLSRDIQGSLDRGNLTMLGEVGLDGGARMRWPLSARHLSDVKAQKDSEDDEQGEWKRVTPFKVSMNHQKAIVKAQMEIAIELGVNISFHSVAAAGPTMDVLTALRDTHRATFTNRVNVDIHSGGGWSPVFWKQAEKQLLNLYASPSIFITSRSSSANDLIRSISTDRILVESDSHDVRVSTRLVWAATLWIAREKGWRVEDESVGKWVLDPEEDEEKGMGRGGDRMKEVWTVKTLERNWARFMGLISL